MWKFMAQLVVGGFIATQVFSMSIAARAADSPAAAKGEKSARKAKHTKFRGTIKAVDNKVAMTLTVAGKDGDQTLQITSKTRLFKAGKPAVVADAVVGDEVRGTARETADGKVDAITIYLGPQPEGEKKTKRSKRSKKAAPAPEVVPAPATVPAPTPAPETPATPPPAVK